MVWLMLMVRFVVYSYCSVCLVFGLMSRYFENDVWLKMVMLVWVVCCLVCDYGS